MDKLIELAGKDWGVVSKIIVLLMIYTIFKERKTILALFKKKNKKNNAKAIDNLKFHSIFAYLRDWRKFKIGNINEHSPIWNETKFNDEEIEKRLWNTKRILDIKITYFELQLKNFTKKAINAIEKNDNKFKMYTLNPDFWVDLINRSVVNYERLIEKSGVNVMFVDKFHNKHNGVVDNLKKRIITTLNNSPFNDYSEYIYSILGLWETAFILTFGDIGSICKMNGELSESLKGWEIPQFTFSTKLNVSVSMIED